MRIAICDDMAEEREQIIKYLHRFDSEQILDYVADEYSSAETLLLGLTKEPCDIIFFDIYMGGMNGIDAAKQLKQNGFTGQIIFTTTSLDHAVDSYRIAAEGYLVKPFGYKEFADCFLRVLDRWQESFKSITVTSDRLEFQIYLKDIDYIETADHACLIHAKGEVIKTAKTIGYFANLLASEACFLRCHQSFIVNLPRVRRVEDEFIYMKNGDKVPIPIRERKKIKQIVLDYYFKKTRE